MGEGREDEILRECIKLGKIDDIFIREMDGDDIFGVGGVLRSGWFEGGENKGVSIIGGKGIEN